MPQKRHIEMKDLLELGKITEVNLDPRPKTRGTQGGMGIPLGGEQKV